MTKSQHYKKSIALALPVMLGQLGHVMVGLADSIMIGQIGTIPLAASAFANSIFAIPLVFGIGMAYGMTPPIAMADGENNTAKAGNFLKHGLAVNLATGLLIFLLVLLFSSFSHLLGQEPEVLEMSYSYLYIITSSIFFFMLFLTFKQFAEGLSDTIFAMWASIGANLINILLNYLMIYGNWGFPELGLEGAGYATLISRGIMALVMMIYVLKNSKFKKHLKDWLRDKWHRSYFKTLLDLGIPGGLQYVFEISAFALAAIFAGQIGASSLAAHQVAISLAALSYMAASGLGAAATVRVGNQLGRKDFYSLKEAARSCFVLALAFMAICGLIFYLGRDYFPLFYTDDLEVIKIASSLLVIAVVFQLSDGLQVAVLGALRGMSDVKIPTIITFFSYWIIGIGGAYGMGIYLEWGPQGIWYGLASGLTVSALLLYWRFHWKLNFLAKKAMDKN